MVKKVAKGAITKAKAEACKDLSDRYDSPRNHDEGQRRAMRIAKQKGRISKDVYQRKQMKDESGVVLIEDAGIRERWRLHFEKLMNVEKDTMEREIEVRTEKM